MIEEHLIEKIEPLISKLIEKKSELEKIYNEGAQEEEVTAKTYIRLCDFLTNELHQLGLIKELSTMIVDKVFTAIFFTDLRMNFEPLP